MTCYNSVHYAKGSTPSPDICDFLDLVCQIVGPILQWTMMMLVLVLIFMSLLLKEKDHMKWYIFHVAAAQLVYSIVNLIYNTNNLGNDNEWISLGLAISMHISYNSTFPLALSRVLFIYYEKRYERVFRRRWIIFAFLLVFDLFKTGVVCIDLYFPKELYNLFSYVFDILFNILTLTFSILTFVKIKSLINLVSNTMLNTIQDLRKAAIICLFQACFISIYLLFYVFAVVPWIFIELEPTNVLQAYIIVDVDLLGLFYFLYGILDTIVTLFVLKTYRKVLRNGWKTIRGMVVKKRVNGRVEEKENSKMYASGAFHI